MTGPQAGDPDISDRADGARQVEAMTPSALAAAGGGGDPARLAALEERVREAMAALGELVRADIPETVESLRDEMGSLRVDVQSSLDQAAGDFAQERQELRAQIAKTVGAANKWFVKARDQLLERLDEVKAVAAEAEAKAGEAAKAAGGARPVGSAPAPLVQVGKPQATVGARVDNDAFEWDVEDGEEPQGGSGGARKTGSAPVELAIDAPELDTLIGPVRADIFDLQGEISAMGHVLAQLRGDVAALGKRLPARPKPVRLDERDIGVIVEAVLVALEPAPPAKKASARRTVR